MSVIAITSVLLMTNRPRVRNSGLRLHILFIFFLFDFRVHVYSLPNSGQRDLTIGVPSSESISFIESA